MTSTRNRKGSTMDNTLYNEAATGQLSSHEITKKALKESLTRVLKFNSPTPRFISSRYSIGRRFQENQSESLLINCKGSSAQATIDHHR